MLLKYTNGPLVGKGGKGKGKFVRVNGGHRVSNSYSTINNRIHRRQYYRLPGKRPNFGKLLPRISPPAASDSSNDSGLGLDGVNHYHQQQQLHHQQQQQSQQQFIGFGGIISTSATAPTIVKPNTSNFLFFNHHKIDNDSNTLSERHPPQQQKDEHRRPKRARVASIALESEDACSNESFMTSLRSESELQRSPINYSRTSSESRYSDQLLSKYISMSKEHQQGLEMPSTSSAHLSGHRSQPEGSVSKDGRVALQIISQPEQQHRARYQTEGSRGAIKDRRGSGFPLVKLSGYNKPTKLQIYIGTDIGRATPHMFYQACKVSSKNSTPCTETKIDGTVVIEVDLKPDTDMTVTCDCIGILKERNVDVELRFPDQLTPKSKKKSTRCRMVFKTEIVNIDGEKESLFICSQPIVCTQPPGVPEICRKSISDCSCVGGQDIFIIGKNFSKDTRVIFKAVKKGTLNTIWEESVVPEQEFLQQTHLICTVPPYFDTEIVYPVNVHLFIVSNGKKSESHNFLYTPQASTVNTLSQLSLTTISGPKAIQQAHGKPSHSDDVSIFENIIGETEKSSAEGKLNVMAPPALPASVSLISIDLQREPSDLQALAAVKAELLEETSQSSIMSEMSQMESTASNVAENAPKIEQSENMDVVQRSMEIIASHQPLGDMIEMQIKQEIARRGSLTQQDEYMLDVESPVTMNQTSNLNTGAIYPQTVPMQSEVETSQQILIDQYQTSLVAATATQLSLHCTQDVLMTQDPTTIRSAENIMNTNITPTIMVPSAVHSGLETVNPILTSNVLTADPNTILSVNVQPPATVAPTSVPMDQDQMNMHQRTSPMAVKNMILNAAADILSSPESTSDETRSTINALIALNTEEILHDPKQDMPSINPTVKSHNLTPSAAVTEFIQPSASHKLEKDIRVEMRLSSNTASPSDALMHVVSKSQSLPIHRQPEVTSESQQALQPNNQQQQQLTSQTQQSTSNNSNNAQTSIPQEIATMSESDLISFINPNAFDQV